MLEKAKSTLEPKLENVSETLLVPLFFKAKETIENGVINDAAAVEIIKRIEYDFSKMATDNDTQILIAIRTKIIDRVVADYIRTVENPVIINLGAGLDTRHIRFNHIKWYQLDLEKPMALRKIFFEEEIRIIKSILDFSWIQEVNERENVLIIIEGVLMYLNENQVKALFCAIGENFSNSKIVFDTIPTSLVKLKKHKSINMQTAPFQWGNNRLSEIENWHFGFRKIENYFYLSKHIERWKVLTLFSHLPHIRNGLKISLMNINTTI
jgi:O-methyltransferase involved in polyketide biosynthesis